MLEHAAGFLRSAVARDNTMRTTPKLRFHYDDLIVEGARIETLIRRAVAADAGFAKAARGWRLMMRRQRGRDVNGMIVVDKPSGASSNDAVQRAKRLYRAQKVGHTGSLDPLATGVLPLCFGEATKFSQFLLDSDKKYWARIRLGVRTDSGDADGQVLETRPVVGVDAAAGRERCSERFRGEIDQVPSMFSAIKHQGQPLYKLARRGIEVERRSRAVTIYSNELTDVRRRRVRARDPLQ